MCGICGFTGKTDLSILKKMTDSIIHRGPDEDGFYSNDKVNLGIRRLSIIDVKTGHQPIHNEDKTIWIVFNGEIYNFIELRSELEKKGHKFYTDHSDSEVLAHLYEENGDDFIHRLNGMFAIALWDNRNEKLLLYRDRMGVKPLFYSQVNGELIFASEIKAILANANYKRNPDHEALFHYFTFKNIPSPLTSFSGIFSLSAGEMVICKNGSIEKKRYWKNIFNENYDLDEKHITKSILLLLEDAVRLRMRSDVPFGAYLSGGVDSSAIVALMTKFSKKAVKTFSLGYEDELKNKEADLYYARKISELYKTEHYEYIMSYKELIDDTEKVIEAFDQPFSGTISTFFLTKLIKKHVKVALSGNGADELFGSYLSHRVAQPMYYYKLFHEKVQSGSLTGKEKLLFAPCGIKFLETLFNKSNGDEIGWRYNLYLFSDEEKNTLLTEYFKTKTKGASSLQLVKQYFKGLSSKDPLNRILEMEWNSQLPDQALAFEDFLSMAHSVEIRSPFLDYRLVEFVSQIPGDIKIKNGVVKDILKKTVETLLPEGIIKRPKEGFVLPIFGWMMEGLKSYCMDVLSQKRLRMHNFFNVQVARGILNDYYAGRKDYAGKVWNLMMFQLWWERYFG